MSLTPGSTQPAPASPAGLALASVNEIASPVNRQRIPFTIDPFGESGGAIADFVVAARSRAVANLYLGMEQVHQSLSTVLTTLAIPTAPPYLIGVLLEPDSTAAARVQVQFDPASMAATGNVVTVLTDNTGAFQIPLPKNMPLPATASIVLRVHGATSNTSVSIPSAQVGANGLVGALVLPQYVAPLPVSIMAALEALIAPSTKKAPPAPTTQPQLPVIKIGEGDDCLLSYGMNSSVDQFPYGVFFRLVEPRASIVSQVQSVGLGGKFTFLPSYATSVSVQSLIHSPKQPAGAYPGAFPALPAPATSLALPALPPAAPGATEVTYVDRVPVEQPISVDGFRDQLMGLQPDGLFTADETRPMAGTLGLGYVLWLAQRWTFQGLSLGNLVYSLPLAPGEQQQVAIFERVDTTRVTESEFFSEEQAERQSATSDTSTRATFDSAFNEAVQGRSAFQTESSSSSWGGSLILISGGSGSSSSSGTSSQSLEGQRNTTQQAAQTTHSAAENQAYARRSAFRTGMRVATASESQQLTTKVITNHNHTHALTMQYWEVLRLYDVTTGIEGLTLTVLVPLQLVRFIPPGQPATLTNPSQVASRSAVLARYSLLIKHGDVLRQALPRQYRHGLSMLLQFAADPTAGVDSFGGTAEDVIQLSLGGTFLPCEDVYISAVTDRRTRLGPVRLANTATHIPADRFASKEQLMEWFSGLRQSGPSTFTGALALPPSMNRSSIVGFEISRSFRPVTYTLISTAMQELLALQGVFGGTPGWLQQAMESALAPGMTARSTITLSPSDLETGLGGPQLNTFSAAIDEFDSAGNLLPSPKEQYANESLGGTELPPQPYPVPALQLAPVLRYNEVLEIEQMAQHVARSTLTYSRAVWASMSADERAILLEAYTIGVPAGGIADATQMVPLLNCVENRVLGFFGNSMMMPFIIPEAMAQAASPAPDGTQMDPAKIQESLLAYHTASFTPPHSTIALPTRGVLGEGVLGHCSSAEKIDLTRFWNWQDSPPDTAPAIAPTSLPVSSPSLTAGVTAPNSLTGLPSLINNVLTAPQPDTSLLQALGKNAASQQDFSAALTGASELAGLITNAQNTSNAARADALKTTKDLTAQTIATVGNIVGGMKGNPTAGSSAAAAVTGAPQPQGSGSTPAPGKTGTGQGSGTTTGAGGGGKTGGTGGPSGGPTGGPSGSPGGGGPGPAPAPSPGG